MKSIEHRCIKQTGNLWQISWSQRYFHYQTINYARQIRHVREAAAKRFCKKWGIEFPQQAGK
jgi:hypothetical protein